MKAKIKRWLRKPIETTSPENILREIQGYPYVSFDVFDTLLKRTVPKPQDVFHILGEHVHDETFAKRRIAAEQQARMASSADEVTLDDIYACMTEQDRGREAEELCLERTLSTRNLWLAPVLTDCKRRDVKILAVSDMYLPQSFIAELLQAASIAVARLYVSSAYGEQKGTGKLFRIVLDDLGIATKDVIHIGDSLRADWMGARKAGIASVLIPRNVEASLVR